ncbi:MAG: hypothetical protein WD076_02875 [Parvularculaceae bacterium]
MLSQILADVKGAISATFLTNDMIGLLIAFGAVLIASLLMRRGGQIGSMTLLALVLFALGGVLRNFFKSAPAEGQTQSGRAASQIGHAWDQFMGLPASQLLAYFVAFMILILILFGLRSVFNRG